MVQDMRAGVGMCPHSIAVRQIRWLVVCICVCGLWQLQELQQNMVGGAAAAVAWLRHEVVLCRHE